MQLAPTASSNVAVPDVSVSRRRPRSYRNRELKQPATHEPRTLANGKRCSCAELSCREGPRGDPQRSGLPPSTSTGYSRLQATEDVTQPLTAAAEGSTTASSRATTTTAATAGGSLNVSARHCDTAVFRSGCRQVSEPLAATGGWGRKQTVKSSRRRPFRRQPGTLPGVHGMHKRTTRHRPCIREAHLSPIFQEIEEPAPRFVFEHGRVANKRWGTS